jgi:glycine cleavage system aminomethyltransferase T
MGGMIVEDVTSLYTALCVMGPFSRALVARLTPSSLHSKNFPFFTAKYMDIGQLRVFLCCFLGG